MPTAWRSTWEEQDSTTFLALSTGFEDLPEYIGRNESVVLLIAGDDKINPDDHSEQSTSDMLPLVLARRERYAQQLQVPAQIPNSTLLEHVATSYFFHHYALPSSTFYRLSLDCMTSVIDGAQNRQSLAEVIVALGILTLPRRSQATLSASRMRYMKALRLTNQSLRDPNLIKKDETILAVVLLGLYETTPDQSDSVSSWNSHLKGAKMLLLQQGFERLRTGQTYKLFIMLAVQMSIHCFMTEQKIPQDLLDLTSRVNETQNPGYRVSSTLMAFFGRLCALLEASKKPDCDANYIIAEAELLDDELTDWAMRLPSNFTYSVQTSESETVAYSRTFAVYQCVYGAEVWNLYRSARMSLNGLIIQQSATLLQISGSGPTDVMVETMAIQQLQRTLLSKINRRRATIDRLRNEFCESMPFFAGEGAQLGSIETLREAPHYKRTLILHMLQFIICSGHNGDQMAVWAEGLRHQIQDESQIAGSIWMNQEMEIALNKRAR